MALTTILIAGAVDDGGKILYYYTIPDNLPQFPKPPFEVHHTGNGFYDLDFNGEVFDEAPGPVVTATVYARPKFGDDTNTKDNAIVVNLKRSYARIKTGDSDGNASDRSFFFTAIGTYESAT